MIEHFLQRRNRFTTTGIELADCFQRLFEQAALAIGGAIEPVVMEHQQRIAVALYVEFDPLRAETYGGVHGEAGVFRGVARSAAVSDGQKSAGRASGKLLAGLERNRHFQQVIHLRYRPILSGK